MPSCNSGRSPKGAPRPEPGAATPAGAPRGPLDPSPEREQISPSPHHPCVQQGTGYPRSGWASTEQPHLWRGAAGGSLLGGSIRSQRSAIEPRWPSRRLYLAGPIPQRPFRCQEHVSRGRRCRSRLITRAVNKPAHGRGFSLRRVAATEPKQLGSGHG
ncbi:hypothetical protein JHW43_006431 [Diplocarpon mali]|nr:hypothetical protein JHW43_006431 [Diplocarpon mali]